MNVSVYIKMCIQVVTHSQRINENVFKPLDQVQV